MSVVKVLEVISEGKTVEEAIKAGVSEVAKTLENITQINVEHISGVVKDGKVIKYRVNAKVSFVVEHGLKNH